LSSRSQYYCCTYAVEFLFAVVASKVVDEPNVESHFVSGACLCEPALESVLKLNHLGPVIVLAGVWGGPLLVGLVVECDSETTVRIVEKLDLEGIVSIAQQSSLEE
jgi:hypothetical protein